MEVLSNFEAFIDWKESYGNHSIEKRKIIVAFHIYSTLASNISTLSGTAFLKDTS